MKRKAEIKNNIRSLDFEILNTRTLKKEKIITIGLVGDFTDSYRTVIKPEGCISPLESVPVDYLHNRINTGCTLVDLGIQTKQMPDGDGRMIDVDVRVVDVHVPVTAKAWTQDNKNTPADEVPSLYDYVDTGRVRWGSVDFTPVEDAIELVYKGGKLIREVFTKWSLNYFSLLDVKPGQDMSYTYNIRSLTITKKSMNLTEIKNKLTEFLRSKNLDVTSLEKVEMKMESDEKGIIRFALNEENKEVNYTRSEDGELNVEGEVADVPIEKVEEKSTDTDAKTEDATAAKTEEKTDTPPVTEGASTTETNETEDKEAKVEETPERKALLAKVTERIAPVVTELKLSVDKEVKSEDAKKRWADVGGVVKNLTGLLAKVVSYTTSTDTNGNAVSTATLQTTDGTTILVNADQIGNKMYDPDGNFTWTYITQADMLDLIVQLFVGEEGERQARSKDLTDKDEELRIAKETIVEKTNALVAMTENYDKLNQSPKDKTVRSSNNSAVDNLSDSENEKTESTETKVAKAASKARFIN